MSDLDRLERGEQALAQYFETYFHDRDLDRVLALFDDHMVGFGTGRDEIGLDKNAFRELYKRDIESVLSPIAYTVKQQVLVPITATSIIAVAVLDLTFQVADQHVALNNLRQSIVFRFDHDRAWIVGMHISFPTDVHEEGEAYPLKEIEEISQVVQRLVNEKTRDLDAAYHELEQLVITDRLTSLYNRNRIDQFLQAELRRAKRYDSCFAVILIDLDHFKLVNDTFGHLVGDEVLTQIARIIRARIRETDLAARWGGEEFLITLPETSAIHAEQLANMLRQDVACYVFNTAGQLTISAGVTENLPHDSLETLFARADAALYNAKHNGRNRVEIL